MYRKGEPKRDPLIYTRAFEGWAAGVVGKVLLRVTLCKTNGCDMRTTIPHFAQLLWADFGGVL